MDGLMSKELNGVPFSEIMNQAVKLKTHQAKSDRYKWDSYPKFFQNSMFSREEIESARAAPFAERIQCALAIKAEADGHLRSKNLLEASFRYEHALACFKWLQNVDPGWKKKGINDSDISEHAYSPANADEATQVATLLVALYLNLARVYFKTGDFTTAITACGAALDVDENCDKALFLRAQVRIAPASAGATEHEASLKDAAAAQKVLSKKLATADAKISALQTSSSSPVNKDDDEDAVEPEADGCFDLDSAAPSSSSSSSESTAQAKNNDANDTTVSSPEAAIATAETVRADLTKRAREVNKYVKTLRDQSAAQKVKDKEWGGVFQRGEIYDPETIAAEAAAAAAAKASGNSRSSDGVPQNLQDVKRQLDDAKRLLQVYESRNQHEEADKVRLEIEASEKRIAAFEKSTQNGKGGGGSSQPQSATATKPQVDFFNPTPEMKADALDKGLDLDDPAVLKILQKLQDRHEASGEPITDESVAAAFDDENKASMSEFVKGITPLIEAMSSAELRTALDSMNVPTSEVRVVQCAEGPDRTRKGPPLTREKLVEAMVQAVIERGERGEGLPDGLKLVKPTWYQATIATVATSLETLGRCIPGVGAQLDAASAEEEAISRIEDPAEAAKKRAKFQRKRTFRVTFVASVAFFTVRILWSGHMRELARTVLKSARSAYNDNNDSSDLEEEDMYGGSDNSEYDEF